jgi:hypothetical protein
LIRSPTRESSTRTRPRATRAVSPPSSKPWQRHQPQLRLPDGKPLRHRPDGLDHPPFARCAAAKQKAKNRLRAVFSLRKKTLLYEDSDARLGVWQKAGFGYQQLVVAREIHDEIPRHDIVITQIRMHNDTLHAIQRGRQTPRRISKIARSWFCPSRPKRTHHSRKALRPVTGAKSTAVGRNALDKDFCGVGSHWQRETGGETRQVRCRAGDDYSSSCIRLDFRLRLSNPKALESL